MESEVLLEDKMLLLDYINRTVKLQLRSDNLYLSPVKEERTTCKTKPGLDNIKINLADILGVFATENKNLEMRGEYTSFPNFLQIFWYPPTFSQGSSGQLVKYERRHLVLSINSDEDETLQDKSRLNLWVKYIKYCKQGLPKVNLDKIYKFTSAAKKPILFILNPKSGQGRGEAIFWKSVAPVFTEAGTRFVLRLTCRPNHARELMRHEDIDKWSAIVAVSGDGLLHEMVNGLFEREDWRTASKIPIGIIPAGSGNGLSRSLLYYKNEELVGSGLDQASLGVAKGNVQPMDLTYVETENSSFYSFLSIGYALFSDVDIESEWLRWMGEFRFYVLTCARIISRRYYRAKLSYLPADEEELPNTNLNQSKNNEYSRIRQDTSSSEGYHSYQDSDEEPSSSPGSDADSKERLQNCDSSKVHAPEIRTPCLSEPVPSNWKTIEDDFVVLSASYQSHLAKTLFVSPDSRPNDGVIWLYLIRSGKFEDGKVPMSMIINFFLNCTAGAHVNHEKCDMIPVKAFRLEPHDTSVGHLTIDGELIETGPIQATVLPNAANIVA